MCAVCGVETASDVFEPCGHVVLCGACMQPDDCPACASQKDPAQDFEFAPGFVPVQDEDWLLLSLNRAKKTREKFVEACCLQIWSANFLGAGKGFMCIQSTAALLGVSQNYLTKPLAKLGGKSRRAVWMEALQAKERAREAMQEDEHVLHGGGDWRLQSPEDLAQLDTRTCEKCECGKHGCTCMRMPVEAIRKLRIEYSEALSMSCLLYTSPSPRDKRQSRMPSSA